MRGDIVILSPLTFALIFVIVLFLAPVADMYQSCKVFNSTRYSEQVEKNCTILGGEMGTWYIVNNAGAISKVHGCRIGQEVFKDRQISRCKYDVLFEKAGRILEVSEK